MQPKVNPVAIWAFGSFTRIRSGVCSKERLGLIHIYFVVLGVGAPLPLWCWIPPGLLAGLTALPPPIIPELLGDQGAPRGQPVAPKMAEAQWLVWVALINEMLVNISALSLAAGL